MNTYLCVVFGYGEEAEVWAANIVTDRYLNLGEAAKINLSSDTGEELSIDGEIIHVGLTEEGNNYAIAVAEEAIEDEELREALLNSEWTLLEEPESEDVFDIVDTAPPVAALHDLLLVVGDYKSVDEFGYPNAITVWHRVIEPDDVSVPLFGERFYSHIILSNAEIEPQIEEYELEEGLSLEEVFEEMDTLEDAPYDGEDKSATSDEEQSEEPLIAPTFYIEAEVSLDAEGNPEDGYPVVAFYTAKVDYGVASIGVWTKNIDPYTEFDMIADGWELLGPELFNPLEFRLKERIDIAMQTLLSLSVDEEENRFIHEYALTKPEEIVESQFDLIPPALQDFVVGVKEISQDIDNIDALMGEWVIEDENNKKD
jgi:hypothetical protein